MSRAVALILLLAAGGLLLGACQPPSATPGGALSDPAPVPASGDAEVDSVTALTGDAALAGPGAATAGIDDGFSSSSDGIPDSDDTESCTADESSEACGCDESVDTDSDGFADCFDICPGHDDTLDADRDGLPDCLDDLDPDVVAALLADSDGDGRRDVDEALLGTDPLDPTDGPDIDGDGIPNGEDDDVDGDGAFNGNDSDIDGDGILNGNDGDRDGDGLLNAQDDDGDGDGIDDARDRDDDGDGETDEEDEDGTCEEDGDCDQGEKCRRGNCFTACTEGGTECGENESCTNTLCVQNCDPNARFASIRCNDNEECREVDGQEEGRCVALCASNDDCTSGETCNRSNRLNNAEFLRAGTCELRCTGDEQCGTFDCDFSCGNGNCIGPNACRCEPGWRSESGSETACTEPVCADSRGRNLCEDVGLSCVAPGECGDCTSVLDCDPGDISNSCQVQRCVEFQCVLESSSEPGCCATDADCQPENECRDVECVDFECVTVLLEGRTCCTTDEDCADENECSFRACDTQTNLCADELEPVSGDGCCSDDTDCADGNSCSVNGCDTETFQCLPAEPASGSGCCASDDDCEDDNECTDILCDLDTFECLEPAVRVDLSGCCEDDDDCDELLEFCDEDFHCAEEIP